MTNAIHFTIFRDSYSSASSSSREEQTPEDGPVVTVQSSSFYVDLRKAFLAGLPKRRKNKGFTARARLQVDLITDDDSSSTTTEAEDLDAPIAGLGVGFGNSSSFDSKSIFIPTKISGGARLGNELRVIWGNDVRYWRWFSSTEDDGTVVQVAELLAVCWLDVSGKITTSKLPSKTTYEVLFIIKLTKYARGWNFPVTIGLHLQGIEHQKKLSLSTIPLDRWIELKAGEFVTSSSEDIVFFLREHDEGGWKSGLLIKGVVVRPK